MFFFKSKNSPGSESGPLIYADPQRKEPKQGRDPGGRRRRWMGLLSLGAVLILLGAAMTLGLWMAERQARYDQARTLLAQKEYDSAREVLEQLGSFRDSRALAARLEQQAADYDAALALLDQQRYEEAQAAFRALGDYADSAEQAACGVTYRKALDLIMEIDVGQTGLLTRILTEQVRLTDENSYPTTLGYEVAAALLESLGDYKSAPALRDRCYYSAGLVKLGWKDWEGALACMDKMTPATAEEFCQEYQQRFAQAQE